MKELVNIIIPAVKIDEEVLNCLEKIKKIKYKNFFVTLVLDVASKSKIQNFKYKINYLISGKINMSKKRNIAAKKYKSKYIAFIDSDAYPNRDWLEKAVKYLKQKKGEIVGGPGIPFPNQNYLEKICYYSKRSYYVTGYLNFRKYKASKRYCDWLESCNLIMEKSFFLKFGGMNPKLYTGEDKEFFERVRKKNPELKVFYSPDLYIYHREREFVGFLLQRLCFGMDFINLIKLNSGLKGFQPILPIFSLFCLLIILASKIELIDKFTILGSIILIFNAFIFIDVTRYVKKLKTILLTLFTINLVNLTFAFGGVLTLIGLKKFLLNNIYLFSRKRKKH
jgi:GT2 family glycosyltransferase